MNIKKDHDQTTGLTVKAFKVITGDGRVDSPERGELFLSLLELVRVFKGNPVAVSNPTLEDAIGENHLSRWARWVVVDADGEVWEYGCEPERCSHWWSNTSDGMAKCINKIAKPSNFKDCIWEIRK